MVRINMKNEKQHLNIDLEFLDKKHVPKINTQVNAPKNAPVSVGHKHNWKNIIIVGAIIFFIGWVIIANSDDSSTSSTTDSVNTSAPVTATLPASTANNKDLTAASGQTYSCSDFNYDKAIALKPSVSTVASLNSESATLDQRTAALKVQSDNIDAMYVDQSDQSIFG